MEEYFFEKINKTNKKNKLKNKKKWRDKKLNNRIIKYETNNNRRKGEKKEITKSG